LGDSQEHNRSPSKEEVGTKEVLNIDTYRKDIKETGGTFKTKDTLTKEEQNTDIHLEDSCYKIHPHWVSQDKDATDGPNLHWFTEKIITVTLSLQPKSPIMNDLPLNFKSEELKTSHIKTCNRQRLKAYFYVSYL
jgi:hypothetical protein